MWRNHGHADAGDIVRLGGEGRCVREGEAAERKGAEKDFDALAAGGGAGVDAPRAADGPEGRERAGDARREADFAARHVVTEAGERLHEPVGRHCADVVRAAFDLVPRIALRAVVARADGGGDFLRLADATPPREVCREGPLEAGHALAVVGDRDDGLAPSLRPRDHDGARFVVRREDAPRVRRLAHRGLEVVAQDRAKRGVDASRVEEVVRGAVERRPERPEVRVDGKPAADLVFHLAVLGVPVPIDSFVSEAAQNRKGERRIARAQNRKGWRRIARAQDGKR